MFFYTDVCTTPSILNGRFISTNQDVYIPGVNLLVYCDTGYVADSNVATCTESRVWDPTPACRKMPVLCNDTKDVVDIAVEKYPRLRTGFSGNVSFNSTNFILIGGTPEVTCDENGQLLWTDKPEFSRCYTHVLLSLYYICLKVL